MKGSPILATALACLIMLGMYAGMRVAFSQNARPTTAPQVSETTISGDTSGEVTVYAEIYFSNQPKNFSLSHPDSGKLLLSVTDPDSTEWSGEITIPVENLTSGEIEFLGTVEWADSEDGHHFMQVIISPTDLDTQSSTLRAEGDIADIMQFHWRENEK